MVTRRSKADIAVIAMRHNSVLAKSNGSQYFDPIKNLRARLVQISMLKVENMGPLSKRRHIEGTRRLWRTLSRLVQISTLKVDIFIIIIILPIEKHM